MTKPITPEMIAAWRTLQEFALAVRQERAPHHMDAKAAEAIDLLDNSDWMVPIEQEGLCGYQVGGGYHTPPEYCEAEVEGAADYCPEHKRLADMDSQLDPTDMARHQQAD